MKGIYILMNLFLFMSCFNDGNKLEEKKQGSTVECKKNNSCYDFDKLFKKCNEDQSNKHCTNFLDRIHKSHMPYSPKEIYTEKNNKRIDEILNGQNMKESDWVIIIGYLTINRPRIGDISAKAIPDYDKIAQIITKNNKPYPIKLYLDFIKKSSSSADEQRSLGVARIYDVAPKKFLDNLSVYNETDKNKVISTLAWGLVNLKAPIDKSHVIDLKSLFPGDKSIYHEDYIHRDLVQKINQKILVLLDS